MRYTVAYELITAYKKYFPTVLIVLTILQMNSVSWLPLLLCMAALPSIHFVGHNSVRKILKKPIRKTILQITFKTQGRGVVGVFECKVIRNTLLLCCCLLRTLGTFSSLGPYEDKSTYFSSYSTVAF